MSELIHAPEMNDETSDLWQEEMKKFSQKGGFALMVKDKGGPGALDLNALLPTFADIEKLNLHTEYVIDRLIPKESLTMIHARGGLGKTWLAQQLGGCVAEGKPFCGLPTQKMLAYYTDYENSLSLDCERTKILGPSSMRLWHISNSISLPHLDSPEWILFKSLFPGLLIFDTLRSAQLLDENSSRDMALIMGRLKELRSLGFTIILLHHTQKADARTYKGSSAILDLCDHVLGLERVKEVGSDTIVDEDETDLPFRLGTREKTRYEPFSIFLKFDPSRGFYPAEDPDEALLLSLRDLLEDCELNQSGFFKLAKDNLEMRRRKFLSLLRKGEGRFWTKSKSSWRNQTVYRSVVHDENQLSDSQLFKNTELSSYPDSKRITETTASYSVVPVVPPFIREDTGQVTTDLYEEIDEGE